LPNEPTTKLAEPLHPFIEEAIWSSRRALQEAAIRVLDMRSDVERLKEVMAKHPGSFARDLAAESLVGVEEELKAKGGDA